MRAIIGRKIYDTQTAKLLAEWENNFVKGEFKYEFSHLYKTLRGNFFLHQGGGPLTRFGQPSGNNCISGSEKIVPISKDEAVNWASKHDCLDLAQEIGGSSIEIA